MGDLPVPRPTGAARTLGEDGKGWTTMAVDRQTRAAAIGQADTQSDAAMDAARGLYGEQP